MVFFNLLRAVVHDGLDVILVELYYLFCSINEEIVGSLEVAWVVAASSRLRHSLVIVELPVYPDGCIVAEEVQLTPQILHQVAGQRQAGSGSPYESTLGLESAIGSSRLRSKSAKLFVEELLLLLHVGLDTVDPASCAVFLDDVDQLVHFLPKAEHGEVAHTIEQVVIEGPPLVNLDLPMQQRLSWRRGGRLFVLLFRGALVLLHLQALQLFFRTILGRSSFGTGSLPWWC